MNSSITAQAPSPVAHPSQILGFGDWLRKAAAPTFAAMGLLSGLSEHAVPLTCAALSHAGHVGGMTAMYLLMALFHLSAWLPRGTTAALQSTSRS